MSACESGCFNVHVFLFHWLSTTDSHSFNIQASKCRSRGKLPSRHGVQTPLLKAAGKTLTKTQTHLILQSLTVRLSNKTTSRTTRNPKFYHTHTTSPIKETPCLASPRTITAPPNNQQQAALHSACISFGGTQDKKAPHTTTYHNIHPAHTTIYPSIHYQYFQPQTSIHHPRT